MSVEATKAMLEILQGANAGQFYELNGGQTVLGRHSECQIVLPSRSVSRQHFKLLRTDEGFYLEDLGSLNGTFVNGHRVKKPVLLADGDIIQVHDIILVFREIANRAPRRDSEFRPEEAPGSNESQHTTSVVTLLDIWSGSDLRTESNPQIKLRALLGLIRDVGTSLNTEEVLPRILDSLFEIFPQADQGCILYCEGNRLVPRAVKSRHGETGSSVTIGPISSKLARRTIGEAKAILSTDSSVESREVSETIFDMQCPATMCAPLMLPARPPLGVIQVHTEGEQGPFLQQDLDVLSSISIFVGQVLEYARWHEMQQIEEGLEQSENRFRALIEKSWDSVSVIASDGTVLYSTPATERILGYTPKEFVGRNAFELIHPDDLERVKELFGKLLIAPGGSLSAEYRAMHKDGSWRWLEGAGTNLLGDPDVRGIVCNYRDVTERRLVEEALRASESRLRRLVESDLLGMIQADDQGAITEANGAFLDMTGYTREDLVEGRVHWRRMTPPEYLPLDERGLQEAMSRGACTPYQKEYVRKDGRRVPVLIGYALLEGTQHEFVCFILNLTAQKQLEEALRQRNKQLAEADRLKDEFLAMLAHELRNPLAPISNGVQMLKLTNTIDPDLQWFIDIIDRQVQQLTRLVDDLLDVSRITRGKVQLHRERIELSKVIARAIETSQPLIDAQQHQLSVQVPPEPIWLEADPTRLAQVLANLLNNAAKYTPERGDIRLVVEREGNEVVLHVQDNGMGIPAEMLPHVFELFTQVDRSLDRSQGGLGIGLTLVRRLVELHGGSVQAASAGPGRGSDFTVRLPILTAPSTSTARRAPAANIKVAVARRRILVVDDNTDSADSLARMLSFSGHEVQTAYNGPQALEAARACPPEVMLLDIGLPGMSGYEVARQMRADEALRGTILVAMTGYGQEDDRRRSLEAGFNHHMVKPVDLQTLLAILSTTEPPAAVEAAPPVAS